MMPLPEFRRISAPPCCSAESSLEAAFEMHLNADHPAFEGHFPDFPVLPGILQVDWAIRLGHSVFGPLGHFKGLQGLKFLGLIRPGDTLVLRLRHDPQRGTLRFTYLDGEERRSAGTVQFQPPQPPEGP